MGNKMLIDLTPAQIEEAIAYGKAMKDASIMERVKEWVADLGPEIGYATVDTRFKEITRVARTLILQDREISPEKVRVILGSIPPGNLNFSATIYGSTRDFARYYKAFLRGQGKVILPHYEHIPRIAGERVNGIPGYAATCLSVFPIKEIDLNSEVTLELIATQKKEELKFIFTLSKLR